jgi:hypothetical protein
LNILDARRSRLVEAANAFSERLKELHVVIDGKFLAIVYIDEAYSLQKAHPDSDPKNRNPYFALMHVLGTIQNLPIFFIFLSTNYKLNLFAPTDANFPSLRIQKGRKLIPPFFEVPFDAFCCDFTEKVKANNKLTLEGVCELEQMVKFGRPM